MQVTGDNTKVPNAAAVGMAPTNLLKSTSSDSMAAESGAAEMMSYLTGKYKNINFSFLSFDSSSKISGFAANQKGFNNVTISTKLLEKMSADEELRRYVEGILDNIGEYRNQAQAQAMISNKELAGMGLVLGDDAQAYMWTATKERDTESIYPTYWRDRESTSFYAKEAKKKKSVTTYNYSHSTNMMRLANAKNVTAVRGLIAAKYGEIQKVKAQVSDSAEAAAIVRKIKSVIMNGNLKISRLHKEENLQRLQKSAEKKLKEKLARQLAEELRRKKTARKGLEHCQTADIGDIFVKPSLSDEQFRQIAEQYAQSLFPAADVSSGDISAGQGGISEAVDITVMSAPVISVDCCI